MAKFSPIKTIVDNAINLDLANPNLAISDKEAALKEAAISLGCLDYFRSFPMKVAMSTTYNSNTAGVTVYDWASGLSIPKMQDGYIIIPFEEVFANAVPKIPEDQKEHAYFLGIVRCERPAWNTYSNPGLWDKQLLGVQVNNTQFDIMKTILSNTLDDLSTGQPKYWIDRTKDCIFLESPWGFGQLSWEFALGFDSVEYAEYSKVDFLCKFISYRFIESIIQARDGVKLDADFEISTAALQKRLDRLYEEVDSIKNHSILYINTWS